MSKNICKIVLLIGLSMFGLNAIADPTPPATSAPEKKDGQTTKQDEHKKDEEKKDK
jgi:hypothetical protein